MFIFSVRDMRVSSQAAAVLKAVNHVDLNAVVSINLQAHEVRIIPATAGAIELSDAIAHAGFDPVLKDCGHAVRGLRQAPPKIPFEGFDHDFTAASESEGDKAPSAIAGASRLSRVLAAAALGRL